MLNIYLILIGPATHIFWQVNKVAYHILRVIKIDYQILTHEGNSDKLYFQESATISRIIFLDRLKSEFGQKEGRSVLLRLLIPTATMGWKFFKPFFIG